jgi:tetratricopeptide (TPR) repeat protein
MSRMRYVAGCALAVALLSACRSAPPPPAWVGPQPEQLVAEIRAAAQPAPGELEVHPLRDPMVEDLRAEAARAEREGRHADAAAALDRALALSPQDPAVLQERAEIAILERDLERAAALARRAFEEGTKIGPLCRRHWATIRQTQAYRLLSLDALVAGRRPLRGEKLAQWESQKADASRAAAEAEAAQQACTPAGPPRY